MQTVTIPRDLLNDLLAESEMHAGARTPSAIGPFSCEAANVVRGYLSGRGVIVSVRAESERRA
jgi:hypothetical protein